MSNKLRATICLEHERIKLQYCGTKFIAFTFQEIIYLSHLNITHLHLSLLSENSRQCIWVTLFCPQQPLVCVSCPKFHGCVAMWTQLSWSKFLTATPNTACCPQDKKLFRTEYLTLKNQNEPFWTITQKRILKLNHCIRMPSTKRGKYFLRTQQKLRWILQHCIFQYQMADRSL